MYEHKSIYSDRYRRLIQRLVELRTDQGIRQRDLSKKLGRYMNFVTKYETFNRRLDIIEFVDVCGALGENPLELISEVLRIE